MDYIDELFKALTPITQDIRKRVLDKCKELNFDTKTGLVSLDESLINLIDIRNILVDAIEHRKLIQFPITIQKDITSILNELTKFIEGLNAGTNHVENIVNAIEKLNVYMWQYGFHNLSEQVLGYHEKMNQLKILQTELSKLKEEAEGSIQKNDELETMISNINKAYETINLTLEELTNKNRDIAELTEKANDNTQSIADAQKTTLQIEQSLKTILDNSKTVETDIKESEKNITAFSKKLDEYRGHIDTISEKANSTIEQSTAAYNKDRSAVEKLLEDNKTANTAFLEKMETNYNNAVDKWKNDYSTVLAKIEELLPRALTTGLSAAYYDKKRTEITDYEQHTKNFKRSVYGLVGVSLIPFAVSITRLIQNIPIETVILDIPRVVLAILPLYIPVVWLAYSANKKMNLSKRLIEEYTHKEVLSKTYEGLAKQISSLENDSMAKDLRVKLLFNVLEVSSENPGKLISDYAKSDHPFEEALDKSIKLASAVHKLSNVPGFARIVSVLDKKAKEVLKDEMEKAGDGLETMAELQKRKD